MRELINIITETDLTAAELKKHGGAYLATLVDLINKGQPLEITPAKRETYGEKVKISPESAQQLATALQNMQAGQPYTLPPKITIISDLHDQPQSVSLGTLFKDGRFTGRTTNGQTQPGKAYNAGHLNELMMGLATSAKFANLGMPVTFEQVKAMVGHVVSSIENKNVVFSITRAVKYPEKGSKTDTLQFRAVVPAMSAQAFIQMHNNQQYAPDIAALFAGAVKYANESDRVNKACTIVRNDPNNNVIDVLSDGTSDAKGTKADLKLSIDGRSVALLSLKTRSSDTLGQISGTKYESLQTWFKTCFEVNIAQYKGLFDPALGNEQIYQNIYKIYDDVVVPKLTLQVEKQSPARESAIVKHFAQAALFFARGEKLEDVEVVKLDDSLASGNYKIMHYTDDLYEKMKLLDLEVKATTREKGRTVQIMVKPKPGVPVKKTGNLLCQFRTQIMGGYLRNFFETGTMLEELTQVNVAPPVDQPEASPRPKRTTSSAGLGRERR
jgi:hypothetical protein